ncbi:MAG: hypothetical protein CL763_06085 [Chloroflexi bacterium]|nr:hypothetical protein [Chloroflexota bacterium]
MLTSLLKHHHISRSDLAYRLNVTLQTIHNWCSGRVLIPNNKLGILCDLLEDLGVPRDELTGLALNNLASRGVHPARLERRIAQPTPTIMIMTWDLMNPGLFGSIVKLARITLEGLGYQCMIFDCNGEHRIRRFYINEAIRSGVSGLLLCGVPGEVPDPDDDLLTSLSPAIDKDIACVLVKPWTGAINLPPGVASIGWDSIAAVQMALALLVNKGHTEIRALLSGTGAGFGGRYRGVDQAWKNLGLIFNDEESIIWAGQAGSSEEIKSMVRNSTGVFTPPSNLALLAQTCFENNFRWPRDISITSLGNRDFIPQLSRYPFTFVNLPVGRVSRGAAQLLADMIGGEQFQTGQEYVVYGSSTMVVENLDRGSVTEPRRSTSSLYLS